MLTSPIATFINHDLHNKFGVLRTANGMMEMLLENPPSDQQEQLKRQTLLINQTLDRLSESVGNYTDLMNLEIQPAVNEPLDLDYQVEKLSAGLTRSGWRLNAGEDLTPVKISEDFLSFILITITDTIKSLGADPMIEISNGSQQQLIVTFNDGPGDKSSYKNIRELLGSKLKPEAVPHHFNLFFANYLLQKRNGKINLEYVEPGTMAFLINLGFQ